MKIYLASPFFNHDEIVVYDKVITLLRDLGHEVFVPREHEIENAWDLPNNEWGAKVFKNDVEAINNCDRVVALYWGMYSDSGTAWECGYAYGIGKPVEVIICNSDPSNEKYSLMMVNGCLYYGTLEEFIVGKGSTFEPIQM